MAFGTGALLMLSGATYVAVLVAVGWALRWIDRLLAEFSRQKLCQTTGGADIEPVRPVPYWYSLVNSLKPRRFRSRQSTTLPFVTILELALLDQLLDEPDKQFAAVANNAIPEITDVTAWESLGETVEPDRINRVIRERRYLP